MSKNIAMNNFNEHDFIRLRKDKGFANEVLLYQSKGLLKSAFDLFVKKPEMKKDLINSICYSVDKHLSTKNKFKVIHAILNERGNLQIIGLRNLNSIGSSEIIDFFEELTNTFNWIEDKEEGKILEREDFLKELLQNKDIIKENNTLQGFLTKLSDTQIDNLYKKLIADKYIARDTILIDFKAIFKNELLPKNFKKIKWISMSRGKKPHQTSLREFLKATMVFIAKEPDQNAIDSCFTDSFGDKIVLGKNKSTPSTERWSKRFKSMVSQE
jgi:hypothetical protein